MDYITRLLAALASKRFQLLEIIVHYWYKYRVIQ